MKAVCFVLGFLVCFGLLTAPAAAPVAAPAVEGHATLRTLTEKSFKGELLALSDTEVEMRIAGKAEKFPLAEVIGIDLPSKAKPMQPDAPHLLVRMTDGSMFTCQGLAIKGTEGLNVTLRLFNGFSLATDLCGIHWILCDAHDPILRAGFFKSIESPGPGEVIRIESLNGAAIDEYEGRVVGADEKGENLLLDFNGAPIKASMRRVRSIYIPPKPNVKLPLPHCWIKDDAGNHIAAQKIESTKDGFKIVTMRGIAFEAPHSSITHFDFTPGKIAWLSDLSPLFVKVEPILSGVKHYRRDRNLDGGPLSIGGKAYAKGLATHSYTVLEYDVAGYNWFRCVLGIDDLVRGQGDAVVKIELDNLAIFEQAVTMKDEPKELKLNIAKGDRLRITVDYGRGLDLGDHIDLADARISK